MAMRIASVVSGYVCLCSIFCIFTDTDTVNFALKFLIVYYNYFINKFNIFVVEVFWSIWCVFIPLVYSIDKLHNS